MAGYDPQKARFWPTLKDVARVLERCESERMTGKVTFEINMNQGGIGKSRVTKETALEHCPGV